MVQLVSVLFLAEWYSVIIEAASPQFQVICHNNSMEKIDTCMETATFHMSIIMIDYIMAGHTVQTDKDYLPIIDLQNRPYVNPMKEKESGRLTRP
jgi:hypothetical protein